MTSSSIPTIFQAQTSCWKYSTDTTLMDFLPIRQMRVPHHFLQIPQIYAVTWSLTMAPYKVQIIKIGQFHEKSRIFNLLGFANFYCHFIMDIQNHSPTYASTCKGTPGISLMSAILPLKHLKRLSPQLSPYPLDPGHPNHSQDWCSDYALAAVHSITTPDATAPYCIPLPDFFCQNSTMMSMTKSYLQFLKLSMLAHYLEGSGLLIDVSPITRIAILFNDQNPHASTSTLVEHLLIQPCNPFHPENLNQTQHTH